MTRRWSLLAGAIALSLAAPQAAFASPEPPAASSAPDPDTSSADAIRDLKADADGAVRVTRDASGDVAFVTSTDGSAMLDSDSSTPQGSVQEQLKEHGDAFGIDGTTSRAVVTRTLGSATGGTIVRADQVVDGVPVFGGQLVLSLDDHQDVVSVASATTDATQVPVPAVSEARARRTAIDAIAKGHHVSAADLSATVQGRRVYDPAIVHVADPVGARPVWQLEVTNGSEIRETVLVGTDRGEVALHFNDAPEALSRRICDNGDARLTSGDDPVPPCTAPIRTELTTPIPANDDVNDAFDNLGATADAYQQLAGTDLTDLIGVDHVGTKSLEATVQWCYQAQDLDHDSHDDFGGCPYPNAFWDGTQMVFGAGYAGADDVVGHELTHGYVQHTSNLFTLHQSGAINESVADTIGEIVDHRNPLSPAGDAGWTIGEDLTDGSIRSLADPPSIDPPPGEARQPDKMADYHAADIFDDNGAVHLNDGIGNKTAYLISQGGAFNGQAGIVGIDGSDNGLTKTGQLYLEVIKRLTSGAQYADLGRTLVATCDDFATHATDGFTTANCDSVRQAVAATQLELAPTDAKAVNHEAPSTCASGARRVDLRRDDDNVQQFGFTANGLWQRTPANQTPAYTRSGQSSWFGWDPDPTLDGISTSQIISSPFKLPAAQPTYLRFDHAYAMEWYDAVNGMPAIYFDGAIAFVQTLSGSTWTTRTVPWDNGPTKTLQGTSTKVFGGDSHGYGSSRMNLTSLAGQTVRVVFRVTGDQDTAAYGWWVDDIEAYTCPNAVASVPVTTVSAATTSARVAWSAPAYVGGSPVASYRITRSGGQVNTAPASARSITLTGLRANTNVSVAVAAVTQDGHVGAASAVPIYATTARVSSVATVKKNRYFTVTGVLTRQGTTARVAGVRLTLQRHLLGQATWHTVTSATTSSIGTRAWKVRQTRATYYRVIATGTRNYLGTTSAARGVGIRR
ncbi:M4 family metallopeptidase [Marmoricola sp. URHB0036]|uniref:M4 family metallopeptidase n=1 Tax=Marmoricola sp. URHB0036 TaxID=1298863 RepID=UPI00040CF43C|nr:M4 family metallopeptidase [Marmoricola sp. URHB0036]